MTETGETIVGDFACPHCHAKWVGHWHGEPDKIFCPYCNEPIKEAEAS